MKHISYKTQGTCSREIQIDIDNGVIVDCRFIGGCPGNTLGVSSLVKGMKVEEAVNRLSGIKCGTKPTSCPDQLSIALRKAQNEEEKA